MKPDITVTLTDKPKPKPRDDKLSFGRIFTDHMFLMDCVANQEWQNPRIVPYGPLFLDPSSSVLHYGQEIFEGIKAYRSPRDTILLFRLDMSAARMNRSAVRVSMPPIDEEIFIDAVKTLVSIDREWVPKSPGTSLYIRPAMIATEAALGVHPANKYLFFVILSPVGAYYAEGFNPVKILVEEKYVRAVPGGTGNAKTGGNYAASLIAAEEAQHHGCAQALFLDGVERKYIEEVGSMNIAFIMDGTLVTPSLTGNILDGITRDTVLQLARDWNLPVEERMISIDEMIVAASNGSLTEAFGTGTAAVVSPVSHFVYKGEEIKVGNGKVGPVAQRLFDEISDIQRGLKDDSHGWIIEIP